MNDLNDLKETLRKRAEERDEFREQLIEEPEGAVEEVLDVSIPDEVTVEVHRENPGTFHLVLPREESDELGVGELEQVAGGKDFEGCPGARSSI